MRIAIAAVLATTVVAGAVLAKSGSGVWDPAAWTEENTVELRTTDPGDEAHWFPVWLVVLDGKLYVRLLAPEMLERVTAAMADKYWTQGDFIVRRMNHPYTMRLEPEPAEGATP